MLRLVERTDVFPTVALLLVVLFTLLCPNARRFAGGAGPAPGPTPGPGPLSPAYADGMVWG